MTDIINKIIKEFREKFVKYERASNTRVWWATPKEVESFLSSALDKAIQEAREEEKWRIKKAILLIDDLDEAKKIIRKELKEKEEKNEK